MEAHHFTAQDVPNKFSHKHGSSNTFWIIFISVLFFLFLVFSKWNKIEEFFGFSVESSPLLSGFTLGQEVSVEGALTPDGDFITHTHKLATLTSGVFGLKSKTINLNQYSGTVLVEGIVDREYQGIYILDISKVIAQIAEVPLTGLQETGIIEPVPSGQYLPKAGIYLPQGFFEEYDLVSSGKDSLQIKSLATNTIINLDFFTCKRGDANRDCKKLSTTFKDASEKDFTTTYGTVFYKLSEVNSWFFANQELFGYFINNATEQDVSKLSSYLVLPTPEYVKEMIEPNVSYLCKEGNIVMNSVKKSSLSLDKGAPMVTFVGTWEKGTAECSILLDLSLPQFGTVKKFSYKEDSLTGAVAVATGTSPSVQPVLPQVQPSDGAQFPISPEKSLVFTSSRGHSISFPSSKISYKSSTISENLGVAGLNCYVATSVIEYAKKDLIDSEPSVIVYECKIKGNAAIPAQYRAVELSDGRTFLVSVINSAWIDFGNNIQVSLNETQ